jgi:hypothetical protein
MTVLLDNARVGKIARAETWSYELPLGRHTVQLKMDWGYSEPLPLEIEAGDVVDAGCRIRAGLAIWITTVGRKRMIEWHRVDHRRA